MKRFSLNIAGMMALIFGIAIGFAALRGGTVLWASVTFSLAVTLLTAAILGACVARGPSRLGWIGFALFGWVYLGAAFGPFPNGNGASIPPLPLTAAYELLLDAKWQPMQANPGVPAEYENRDPRSELFLWRMAPYTTSRMNNNTFALGSFTIGAPGPGAVVDAANAPPASGTLNFVPQMGPNILEALQLRRIVHALGALAFGLVGAAIGRGFAAWYGH